MYLKILTIQLKLMKGKIMSWAYYSLQATDKLELQDLATANFKQFEDTVRISVMI
jgi:hypothetical protein